MSINYPITDNANWHIMLFKSFDFGYSEEEERIINEYIIPLLNGVKLGYELSLNKAHSMAEMDLLMTVIFEAVYNSLEYHLPSFAMNEELFDKMSKILREVEVSNEIIKHRGNLGKILYVEESKYDFEEGCFVYD